MVISRDSGRYVLGSIEYSVFVGKDWIIVDALIGIVRKREEVRVAGCSSCVEYGIYDKNENGGRYKRFVIFV